MTATSPPSGAVTELPQEGSRVFTGTRPTGPWHIGHMWGVLTNMVRLQTHYDCFYCLVDYHALTTAWAHPERIQGNIREIALDWMAGGIDPLKSTLFVQSHVPEVIEFAGLLNMITPVAWLERNPTYRETLEQNKAAEANAGLFTYPVLQTADICLYKGELVPIGKDQATHLHLSQDIAKTFLRVFKRPIFPVPTYLFAPNPLIPGIDNRKMSKSYGNAIDMKESPESTREKSMRMFTDPQKQRKGDCGRPEQCPVFTFHKIVSPEATVAEVRTGCSTGALGCVDCKTLMADRLNEHLAPMRERRADLARNTKQVDELLGYGAGKARTVARETLREVREVMGLERGFYITDGGLALPPALQFNAQDPEFQGGFYQYFALAPTADRARARAYLIDQAATLQFKFYGFEDVQFRLPGVEHTQHGEAIIIVSGNQKLTIPGVQLQPLGAGYRLHVTVPLDQAKRISVDQLSQTIIDTNPKKIYASSVKALSNDTVAFRVFGKSLSPSDQRVLIQKLAGIMGIPAEGLELIQDDAVNAGPRSISPPVRVRTQESLITPLTGSWSEAREEDLLTMLKAHPESAETHLRLGRFYEDARQRDKATEHYSKYMTLTSSATPWNRPEYIEKMSVTDRFKLIEVLDGVTSDHSEFAQMWLQLALLRKAVGDVPQALEASYQAWRNAPQMQRPQLEQLITNWGGRIPT